jgi:hypothetical protein
MLPKSKPFSLSGAADFSLIGAFPRFVQTCHPHSILSNPVFSTIALKPVILTESERPWGKPKGERGEWKDPTPCLVSCRIRAFLRIQGFLQDAFRCWFRNCLRSVCKKNPSPATCHLKPQHKSNGYHIHNGGAQAKEMLRCAKGLPTWRSPQIFCVKTYTQNLTIFSARCRAHAECMSSLAFAA